MKKTAIQPRDLTTTEVAEQLGVTPRAVLGLIQRGRFPNAQKLPAVNGTYLIPLSDLENYLPVREARKRKSASSPRID